MLTFTVWGGAQMLTFTMWGGVPYALSLKNSQELFPEWAGRFAWKGDRVCMDRPVGELGDPGELLHPSSGALRCEAPQNLLPHTWAWAQELLCLLTVTPVGMASASLSLSFPSGRGAGQGPGSRDLMPSHPPDPQIHRNSLGQQSRDGAAR